MVHEKEKQSKSSHSQKKVHGNFKIENTYKINTDTYQLEPSGPLQACNGTALPFTFTEGAEITPFVKNMGWIITVWFVVKGRNVSFCHNIQSNSRIR